MKICHNNFNCLECEFAPICTTAIIIAEADLHNLGPQIRKYTIEDFLYSVFEKEALSIIEEFNLLKVLEAAMGEI